MMSWPESQKASRSTEEAWYSWSAESSVQRMCCFTAMIQSMSMDSDSDSDGVP